jgi:hypothetical protein
MFDIFAQYATDPKLELEGTWITVGPTPEGGTKDQAPALLIARQGNRRHGRLISKLWEANKTTLERKDDAADDKGEEITIDAAAKAILLGWRNIGFQGKALANSDDMTPEERLDTARKLLAVKDFRVKVLKHADDFKEFALVREEAEAGN